MDTEKLKILLIEDNVGDARLIKGLLDEAPEAPFNLEHVDSISKGLARLAHGGVDVILLDLSLPDSQGLESLNKILGRTLVVPIVVLSGLSDEVVAIKAVQAGAQDYLVKGSIDSNLLIRSLHYAIERQRLRVALEESQARYRLLADNVVDVIWNVDMNKQITYVSPSVTGLLGYTVDELREKSFDDIVAPGSAEVAHKVFARWLMVDTSGSSSQPRSVALEHVRKDGSTVWAEVRASHLRDENGKVVGILGVTRDISERKKAEEALRESEARYRLLADNIADVVWTADMEARITYVSPSIKRLLGYTAEETMRLKISDILTSDSTDQARRFIKWQMSLYARGTQPPPVSMTLEHIRKDGSKVWAEVMLSFLRGQNGRIIGIMGATRDITERKKAEEALRESEERYRELFENANDIIYTHDLDGNFTSINKAGERVTGYVRDEVVEMNISRILTPESLELARQMLARKTSQGGSTQYELEIVANDGRRIPLEVSSRLIYEDGKPVGVQGIARDITERKKMEQELLRLSDAVGMSTDSIVITDLKGNIIDVNGATLKIQGVDSKVDLVGLRPFDTIVPEEQEKALKDLAELMEKGYVKDIQYHLLTRDGRKILVETSASLMKDKNGQPIGIVAVSRDITERKQIEEELRRSEEMLRLYFQKVSDVIYSFDTEFRVLNVSPAVERLLGYKPEELIGRPFYELNLVTPTSLERAFSDVFRVFAGEHVISSREFIAKDGTIKFGEVSLAPLYSAEGKVIGALGVGRDITERKKMEESLRQSELDYRTLFDSTIDGMAVIDAETLKVLLINQPILDKYGSGLPEDIFKGSLLDFVYPEDRERALKLIVEDMFEKDTREVVKIRVINSDGKVFWLSCRGARIEYKGRLAGLFSLRDITEQEEAEEALRQSENNYRVLFESTIDGMVVIDGETLEVMFANRTAAKLAGFDSAQDLIGLNPLDFLTPDKKERAYELIKEEVFEKDLHRAHEYRYINKDGSESWVSAVSTRTEFRGKPAALVSVSDITERKRAEEEKRKLEEQIQLAGRLAAVGELAAGVAHELNNPIAAIKGFAQLLAAKEDVDAGTKKDLQTIFRESQRASKITQNLLTFARRHEPEKRFISINEALEKTLELRAHQMKLNNIELVEELDPNLPRTMADFHQMQQVFLNIINNAEQAMVEAHGKGKLIVRTRKVGGMIQINFIDDGPGISEENLKRIFDPFFTTKEVGKGTGLGLSICYGLVEAHYGRMYAKSKLGKGATFVMEIPIVSEEQVATESPALSPGSRGELWKKREEQY